MISKNTTIQNKSKQARLNSTHFLPVESLNNPDITNFLMSLLPLLDRYTKEQVICSIGEKLLKSKCHQNINTLLQIEPIPISINNIPTDFPDILGCSYQYLNTKLENLEKGSFYTSPKIAMDFVSDLDFSNGQTIFDPSCGSGSFLFNSDAPAEQMYGVDFDANAILIAKINYYLKYPSAPPPNIFCDDFFNWSQNNDNKKFNYIIGNPPYGANIDLSLMRETEVVSGESFSYFIESSLKHLEKKGILRFLLPAAILNVKRHTDIRNIILNRANLKRIKKYQNKFAGVMSDVYMIELDGDRSEFVVFDNGDEGSKTLVPKKLYKDFTNKEFIYLNEMDARILDIVENNGQNNLSQSIFGLGVVTGDNKTKLLQAPVAGAEPIYTGKEINDSYSFAPAKNYIIFERSNLQQVAPDEIYRSPKKLVYKTINKNLKFVIDTSKSLTTNSANIVIPQIDGLSIYSVLALLNSKLFTFVHYKMFGGVNKVAKEHLMALPLPALSKKQDTKLTQLTIDAIATNNDEAVQEFINSEIYHFNTKEINYIYDFVDNVINKKNRSRISKTTC